MATKEVLRRTVQASALLKKMSVLLVWWNKSRTNQALSTGAPQEVDLMNGVSINIIGDVLEYNGDTSSLLIERTAQVSLLLLNLEMYHTNTSFSEGIRRMVITILLFFNSRLPF